MKLFVLREYAAYGETHSEADEGQIENNEVVQRLLEQAYWRGYDRGRDEADGRRESED